MNYYYLTNQLVACRLVFAFGYIVRTFKKELGLKRGTYPPYEHAHAG